MKKANPELYTADGRISPDRAIKFVHEQMLALSPEEFRRMVTTPPKMHWVENSGQQAGEIKKKSRAAKPVAPRMNSGPHTATQQ